ncbi:hypothetical protein HPB51_020989 [Rhipicephalus microplus]|uniref:Uncharacterized protein n=1 Tax=Rhipicephalus microplus TaxID=6941 RepID=A0A9J6DXA2_RHIMP|nr:hypothetical protein HPB51_020989 [Rhipicephalus microplus]
MKKPKAIQVELRKATSNLQKITEVRKFGRGGILCCSADQECIRELLQCSEFAAHPESRCGLESRVAAFSARAPGCHTRSMGTCRFISVCEEWACRNYMSAIELSLNGSQDPCNNFHRFVCHGWKHRQQLLSVVDVAEDAMYGRALSALAWSDNEGSSHQDSSVPPTLSVKNKIAGFVKSCIELARSSLLRSQIFMAKRHLPWPKPSRWDPFEILLDLSDTATPGIATGRLLLLLNEYFIWTRRFSARDVVEVENAGLLASIKYLLGLKAGTREALTLSLGLRTSSKLG